MRTTILIDKNGNLINPPITAKLPVIDPYSGMTLFNNQITLSFYNDIKFINNDIYVPDPDSVVILGLSGTVTFQAKAVADSPYWTDLANPTIDISSNDWLPFYGIAELVNPICTGITGANYILLTIDKN